MPHSRTLLRVAGVLAIVAGIVAVQTDHLTMPALYLILGVSTSVILIDVFAAQPDTA